MLKGLYKLIYIVIIIVFSILYQNNLRFQISYIQMINKIKMNSNQVCNEHKEIIIAIEFNLDSQKDFIQMCSVCVTERTI